MENETDILTNYLGDLKLLLQMRNLLVLCAPRFSSGSEGDFIVNKAKEVGSSIVSRIKEIEQVIAQQQTKG